MKRVQAEALAAAIREEVEPEVQVEVQPGDEIGQWQVYIGGEMRVWFKQVVEWVQVKEWLHQQRHEKR